MSPAAPWSGNVCWALTACLWSSAPLVARSGNPLQNSSRRKRTLWDSHGVSQNPRTACPDGQRERHAGLTRAGPGRREPDWHVWPQGWPQGVWTRLQVVRHVRGSLWRPSAVWEDAWECIPWRCWLSSSASMGRSFRDKLSGDIPSVDRWVCAEPPGWSLAPEGGRVRWSQTRKQSQKWQGCPEGGRKGVQKNSDLWGIRVLGGSGLLRSVCCVRWQLSEQPLHALLCP